MALSDCISNSTLMYNFNKYKGLNTYIDSFTSLFCVRINNSPLTGEYYSSLTSLSNEQIDALVSPSSGLSGFTYKMLS